MGSQQQMEMGDNIMVLTVNPENKMNTLVGVKLFSELPAEVISKLESRCTWLEYRRDETIVNIKDSTSEVYFLIQGRLKVVSFIDREQVVELADLEPGDIMGEMAAIDLKERSAKVTALERSLVACMSGQNFRNLLLECPEVAISLLHRYAGFIRVLNSRLTHLSTMTPHQRIYLELLRLAEPNTTGDGSWVISQVPNHEEIAIKAGAERNDVADAIGKLARDAIILRKHKKYIVSDYKRLQRLAKQ